MSTLDVARAELALVVLYLNKAEARDKICRAIQYGSKFLSNGEPGTAQNVDKSTSLARKVFRLFKFVNDLHALISPTSPGTPLPLVLLGKSKNALLSTFLFLDQIVLTAAPDCAAAYHHSPAIRSGGGLPRSRWRRRCSMCSI